MVTGLGHHDVGRAPSSRRAAPVHAGTESQRFQDGIERNYADSRAELLLQIVPMTNPPSLPEAKQRPAVSSSSFAAISRPDLARNCSMYSW
jgi:hypothetical protein